MATRASEGEALAARIKRLGKYGFEIKRSRATGGYRVLCPDGAIVGIHQSPSDRNNYKMTEKLLADHGLAQAEARLAADQAAEREARMAEALRENKRELARAQSRAKATARAAGPYAGPAEVPAEWLLQPHPAPIFKWVIIGPELARLLLDKLNRHNRPINWKDVENYQEIILSGQWRLTHQGMAIDSNGVLQDGQHRLEAIARVGIPLPVPFFCGMDPANFAAIDEGRLRTAGQLLAMEGEAYTTTLAATIRLATAYPQPLPRAAMNRRARNSELYQAWATDADALREAVTWARRNRKKLAFGPGPMAALHYMLKAHNGQDNPYVDAFLSGLVSGLKADSRIALEENDPRLRLREWLDNRRRLRQRTKTIDQLGMGVKTWNYVVDDIRPKALRFEGEGPLPGIRRCQPQGPHASEPPPLLADEIAMMGGR